MSLTIPENRALLRSIAIPSPPPFGVAISLRQLEGGAVVISSTQRSGVVKSVRAFGPEGNALGPREVKEVEIPIEPEKIVDIAGLERFEQSRTLIAQFTSDGTTGDIGVDLGSSPFLGVIQSAQIEVQENAAGTAAVAVRTLNGQSLFSGAGNTQGDVLDLEPDFVPVGLFADPLFVPLSRIPVISGEPLFFVMRLAAGVAAGDVRAKVSVTLQGSGEDLSRQIMLRASVAAPPPSLEVEVSPEPAPVPGVDVLPVAGIGALLRFPDWLVLAKGPIKFSPGKDGRGVSILLVPDLGTEWKIVSSTRGVFMVHIPTGDTLRTLRPLRERGADVDAARLTASDSMNQRQFLAGKTAAFRSLPESVEVEFITDSKEIRLLNIGRAPERFVAEFPQGLFLRGR